MTSGQRQAVYVAVGANIAPEENIRRGLELLARSTEITGVSTFYRTPAIDRPDQPPYLNGVVRIVTGHLPAQLVDLLHEIEHALGRVRTEDRYAARTLDLDVLLYGAAVIQEAGLSIPDPDIRHRVFLAAALLELDPALRLPGDTECLARQTPRDAIDTLERDDAFTRAMKEMLHYEP